MIVYILCKYWEFSHCVHSILFVNENNLQNVDTKWECMVWWLVQSIEIHHSDNNKKKSRKPPQKIMKLASNFLRFSLLIVLIALFSRVRVVQSLRNNNELKHGYCSNLDLRRSTLLVKQNVQKKTNRMLRMFRKNNWTVRFPEVNNFVSVSFCDWHAWFIPLNVAWSIQVFNKVHNNQGEWENWQR